MNSNYSSNYQNYNDDRVLTSNITQTWSKDSSRFSGLTNPMAKNVLSLNKKTNRNANNK